MSVANFAYNSKSGATAAIPAMPFTLVEENETPAMQVVSPPATPAPAAAPVNPNTPAVRYDTPMYSDDPDHASGGDMVYPRISIVQKSGELSNVFPGGALILSKSAVLFTQEVKDASGNVLKVSTAPIRIIVLGFRSTQYTEKVKQGLGRRVDTVEQVVALGGTINYKEWEALEFSAKPKPLFHQTEEALILLRRPALLANDTVNFPFEVGADAYTPALWSMKSTAYTHAAMHFMTARRQGALRRPKSYSDGQWDVITVLKNRNGTFYHQPVVKLLREETSPEVKEFAKLVQG